MLLIGLGSPTYRLFERGYLQRRGPAQTEAVTLPRENISSVRTTNELFLYHQDILQLLYFSLSTPNFQSQSSKITTDLYVWLLTSRDIFDCSVYGPVFTEIRCHQVGPSPEIKI